MIKLKNLWKNINNNRYTARQWMKEYEILKKYMSSELETNKYDINKKTLDKIIDYVIEFQTFETKNKL